MAREQFIDKKFQAKTMEVIVHAQEITEEMKSRGYTLTLRQLFYQFVSRDLLPNEQAAYKRLGSIIDDARQAGLLDWSTIEDRTRNVNVPSTWENPEHILHAVARQYQENPWLKQNARPEVWIEKDALVGVIERVCEEFRVPYFACRGYASQSEIYAAGKRFQSLRRAGFRPIVLYLGDHDPSGMHMPEDAASRLELFSRGSLEVRRLALTMEQIQQYDPPPNPAKDSDSRFEGYADIYGDESWELDALDPDVINQLIRDELDGLIGDREQWDADLAKERENKAGLQGTYDNFEGVKRYLKYRNTEFFVEDPDSYTPDEFIEMVADANPEDEE